MSAITDTLPHRGSAVALSDGIAEGYRQLRQAVRVLLTPDSADHVAATAVMEAVIPVLSYLTGYPRQTLLEQTARRILKDAGVR